jgi:hypothetical protein
MMVRFKGGELLQHGRGIGGLLRLVKSVFKPLVRTAGKTIVKAAKSDVGKQVLKNLKDQAIESGVHLTSAAMRGDDMGEALNNEIQTVKRKAADTVEQVYEGSQKKQRKTTTTPKKVKKPTVHVKPTTTAKKVKKPTIQVQKEGDFFG